MRISVKVNRKITAMRTISATGCVKGHINPEAVALMPVGKGANEVEVIFVSFRTWMSFGDAYAELDSAGYKFDPQAHAAVIKAMPANLTQKSISLWYGGPQAKHECYSLSFECEGPHRTVSCDGGWGDDSEDGFDTNQCFAVVRKS